MFCSDTCQDAAFKMYHKYECLIMKKLDGVKDLVGRLRPFFLALSLFDGSVDRMKATLQGRSGGQRTVFDYDLSDPLSHTYAINLLHVFDSYTTTQHSESFEQINTLFTCDPELNIIWKGNESFVHMLLCRFNDVLRCLGRGIYKWPGNATDIAEQLPDITDSFDTDLVRKMAGVGYYPFLGLINHSCVQNISRHIDADNKMVLIVCRPIKKGEQLFDDYM